MATCITCGTELHPERAKKYSYCTAPECQELNARGLTMVAIGQNKAADEYMILDERTRDEMANGRLHDQRRASFGTPAAGDHGERDHLAAPAPPTRRTPTPPKPRPRPVHPPWSRSQERLALLYNEQGIRPEEIARRLGLSTYTVTQIILAGRNRRRR